MEKKIPVMINGLPGNMASLVESTLSMNPNFEAVTVSLSGPEIDRWHKGKSGDIQLYEPCKHKEVMTEVAEQWRDSGLVIIDFTQPDAIEDNVRLYCENRIPFVTGTTGGNRDALSKMVEDSKISAVIAPNMSVPIVMLMDMIMFAATSYPGALKDWEIRIVESHQVSKKDVSGTALAIGEVLKELGVNYCGPNNIHAIRDEIEQRIMGVPELALGGHGWHKYSLISPDSNVKLGFEHNINGRDTYVNGTLLALNFLVKLRGETGGKCYSMKNVMQG